jgi:integrase-like protein
MASGKLASPPLFMYRHFNVVLVPVAEASRREQIEGVERIVGAEGSVSGTRLHSAYVRASEDNESGSSSPPSCQYRRMVDRLGINFHKLRRYSTTELIRAGVDIRTVARRLGHAEGGTTLTYNAAWVREADQRASHILTKRLPMPITTPTNLPENDSPNPPCPYLVIADSLRAAILDGTLTNGNALPTVKKSRHPTPRMPKHRTPRHSSPGPRTTGHRQPRPTRHRKPHNQPKGGRQQ